MVYINRGRRTGKTTALIIASYVTGYPIIVWNDLRAEQVLKLAKSMGYNDITVFTLFEVQKGKHFDFDKVFVDEALDIIELALANLLNADIVACTLSLPCYEPNENKEEV